jgi:uncharacterized protein (UPF0332 family)
MVIKDSVIRSYYAIFTAARALLATKGLDSSKYSGVVALFNQHFVKTKIVSKEASKLIGKAKLYREQADYGDFFVVSREEAKTQIQSAKRFIAEVVLVLDSCFSGAGGKSVLAKGAIPLVMMTTSTVLPSNIAVLSATQGSQISTSSP